MAWRSWFARPNSTKTEAVHGTAPLLADGTTRGDDRQAVDCYRKVIGFIRHHPDRYDTGMVERSRKWRRTAPARARLCDKRAQSDPIKKDGADR
jgi:hypothetical protein